MQDEKDVKRKLIACMEVSYSFTRLLLLSGNFPSCSASILQVGLHCKVSEQLCVHTTLAS